MYSVVGERKRNAGQAPPLFFFSLDFALSLHGRQIVMCADSCLFFFCNPCGLCRWACVDSSVPVSCVVFSRRATTSHTQFVRGTVVGSFLLCASLLGRVCGIPILMHTDNRFSVNLFILFSIFVSFTSRHFIWLSISKGFYKLGVLFMSMIDVFSHLCRFVT